MKELGRDHERLAGLAAEGTTIVQESEYIDRGYVDVCSDLRSLGACIDRRQ